MGLGFFCMKFLVTGSGVSVLICKLFQSKSRRLQHARFPLEKLDEAGFLCEKLPAITKAGGFG